MRDSFNYAPTLQPCQSYLQGRLYKVIEECPEVCQAWWRIHEHGDHSLASALNASPQLFRALLYGCGLVFRQSRNGVQYDRLSNKDNWVAALKLPVEFYNVEVQVASNTTENLTFIRFGNPSAVSSGRLSRSGNGSSSSLSSSSSSLQADEPLSIKGIELRDSCIASLKQPTFFARVRDPQVNSMVSRFRQWAGLPPLFSYLPDIVNRSSSNSNNDDDEDNNNNNNDNKTNNNNTNNNNNDNKTTNNNTTNKPTATSKVDTFIEAFENLSDDDRDFFLLEILRDRQDGNGFVHLKAYRRTVTFMNVVRSQADVTYRTFSSRFTGTKFRELASFVESSCCQTRSRCW